MGGVAFRQAPLVWALEIPGPRPTVANVAGDATAPRETMNPDG